MVADGPVDAVTRAGKEGCPCFYISQRPWRRCLCRCRLVSFIAGFTSLLRPVKVSSCLLGFRTSAGGEVKGSMAATAREPRQESFGE